MLADGRGDEAVAAVLSQEPWQPRVDDWGLSGIVFVNRDGLRWRNAPKDYGPAKTLYNR